MITLSLCMIVKNEEDVLARCLNSIKDVADEIIIVDTGSNDHTKDIAFQYTDKVYDFEWIDDFSAARNYSFSKATKQYCMWLDADDILLQTDHDNLLNLKKFLSPLTDIVMMRYNTNFDENGNPIFSYFRERIIRNNKKYLWQGAIHEVITPSGNIEYSNIAVTHKKNHPSDPDRNLRIFEKLISNGKQLNAREQFYYARELYYHERYNEAIKIFEEFLSSGNGWIENNIEACKTLSYCYYNISDDNNALVSLLKSFQFDIPRAEICCDIGQHFLDRKNYNISIYWYKTALSCKRNDQSGGFIINDCYDYIPYLQLCICYDKLGDKIQANKYNELAGKCKPYSKAYLYNKQYFNKILEP